MQNMHYSCCRFKVISSIDDQTKDLSHIKHFASIMNESIRCKSETTTQTENLKLVNTIERCGRKNTLVLVVLKNEEKLFCIRL